MDNGNQFRLGPVGGIRLDNSAIIRETGLGY